MVGLDEDCESSPARDWKNGIVVRGEVLQALRAKFKRRFRLMAFTANQCSETSQASFDTKDPRSKLDEERKRNGT